MTASEVEIASRQICDRILACDWYQNAKCILGYYPLGKEVNLLPVLEHALKNGKRVALPKTAEQNIMDFYEINSMTEDVMEGAFHIMEPNAACRKISFTDTLARKNVIVLVPGVTFDRLGNRYGYGKGFYDRYFARFSELYRIGIAYDRQIAIECLEALPTDVKMHLLITEKEQIKM